jgi:tRNA-Thr(GGU) m(6)t(6)A37 methyltransferase TsaA
MAEIPDSMSFTLRPIGVVQSCFKEKFGIPRQPGLAPSARARIVLLREFSDPEAFAGLEQCSHIWVQFIFHQVHTQWQPKVRPPRLGGNKKLGVFASRSPNRPNALGLSVVALRSIERSEQGTCLNIAGVDLLDGTPVLDIKPYVPYADQIPTACNAIAPVAPILHSVIFSAQAEDFCRSYVPPAAEAAVAPDHLQDLIREVLQQDPRPQYQALDEQRIYGMDLLNLNVRWQYGAVGDHGCTFDDHDVACVVDHNRAENLAQCFIKVLDIMPR